MFLGSTLLELIGGIIRYLLQYCYSRLTGKDVKPLSFYFKENKNKETFTNGVGNHVVGVVFLVLIVFAIILFM